MCGAWSDSFWWVVDPFWIFVEVEVLDDSFFLLESSPLFFLGITISEIGLSSLDLEMLDFEVLDLVELSSAGSFKPSASFCFSAAAEAATAATAGGPDLAMVISPVK